MDVTVPALVPPVLLAGWTAYRSRWLAAPIQSGLLRDGLSGCAVLMPYFSFIP